MNPTVRRFITSIPILKGAYYEARTVYQKHRAVRSAERVFSNVGEFRRALTEERPGQHLDLYMRDGLRFTIRQNRKDAQVLAEVFLDSDYVRGFQNRGSPVVIDVGGYIGDFAIYSATHLKAKKVITIEPSANNFSLLQANIRNNNLQDRIIGLQKAVTDGESTKMNIEAPEDSQFRVSAYYGTDHGELKEVPGISIAQIVETYGLQKIDLLKIDCEGGEYTILLTAPQQVLHITDHIVFEYHEIPNFEVLLAEVKKRLEKEGFVLSACGRGKNLISASR